MKQDILIVGGYGAVGKHVVTELVKTVPEKIIIAGRDLKKADNFIKDIGQPLKTLQLDINERSMLNEQLETVQTVVMCVETKDTKFAEACMKNGVNYVDISASNNIPSQIKLLEEKAKENKVSFILGVGIAPGLSTMLASKMANNMEIIHEMNFTLMLGLGEQHGTDGVRWFLENLKTDFEIGDSLTQPFIQMYPARFPKPLGMRKSYVFDLADREIMAQTLAIPMVRTYFCYDSKFMTGLVHVLKKMRLLNMLKKPKIFNLFLKVFSSEAMSKNSKLSDSIGMHITAIGVKHGETATYSGNITGSNSSTVTGKVVAYTVMQLEQKHYPTGVHYLNEVSDLDEVVHALNEDLDVEILTINNY